MTQTRVFRCLWRRLSAGRAGMIQPALSYQAPSISTRFHCSCGLVERWGHILPTLQGRGRLVPIRERNEGKAMFLDQRHDLGGHDRIVDIDVDAAQSIAAKWRLTRRLLRHFCSWVAIRSLTRSPFLSPARWRRSLGRIVLYRPDAATAVVETDHARPAGGACGSVRNSACSRAKLVRASCRNSYSAGAAG